AIADLICVHDESIDDSKPLTIFDPDYTWKTKTLTDFSAEELLVPIFKNGKLVYDLPSTKQIRERCGKEIDRQWDEVKRFEYPHNYYVDLSQKLWDMKHSLLRDISSRAADQQ
nr:nicotinate phosphoribosyltransferase [Clostridiales bacterium]